jgi:plastocyanin
MSTKLSKLTVDNFRIVPRDTAFLDRKVGSKGEIYVDSSDFSLRVYDGVTPGGITVANANLQNVSNADFLSKATSAGVGSGGSSSNSFTTISIAGQGNVVADSSSDTLTLVAGSNITLTTNPGSDTITISADVEGGVTSNSFATISVSGEDNIVAENATDTLTFVAGTGIELTTDADTDSITITNTSLGSNSFSTFAVTGQTSLIADTISDTIQFSGTGITITTDEENKIISFTVPTAVTDSFKFISVAGQPTITADAATDTLTFVAGPNISITTNAGTDAITISATAEGEGASGVSTGQENRLAFYASTGAVVEDTGEDLIWNGNDLLVNQSPVITFATRPTNKFYIAADDSTIRTVQEEESVKFIGGTGITTASDIDGNITIAATGAALAFRTIAVSGQSSVVADTASDTLTLIAGDNITITTNATNDSVTITGSAGGISSNSFNTIAIAGQSSVVADSSTDTLTLVAGTGISLSTDATTDTITITNSVSAPNTFSAINVPGQGQVLADSSTDTLTLNAGTNITISVDSLTDEITINANVSSINFSQLTEVSTASIVGFHMIAYQAIARLTTTAFGSFAYLFDSHYSGQNPTVYAISGTTIAFHLQQISGHPFLIQDGTGTNYSTGLVHVATNGTVSTGAAAQGKESGTLYWQIPRTISGGYRYQCSVHPAMVGSISIKDFAAI